ncbi:hypothetical protein L207DRAFT_542465 [Hyaloscypha variabilis F]|uniref:FAD-binding domain-containing protein n=1 Tax=Hyaloscypha variabilis (strain UAMH 11265 / GT02V1 / F) TaxID=1149755 RepID=A0A2J6RX04_HYAVF|nr:hypothetical protein L207DRAFT_542465 [Hyaloscypha variabilis F]
MVQWSVLLRPLSVPIAWLVVSAGGTLSSLAATTHVESGQDQWLLTVRLAVLDRPVSRWMDRTRFQPPTQEILQILNLRQKLDELGHRLTETSFWSVDEGKRLSRDNVGREVINPTHYQYLFNSDQGINEGIFEADLISRGFRVGRFLEIVDYEYQDRDPAWPLIAYIKNHVSGAIEALAEKLHLGGEDVWAVADVFLNTNFPDTRRRVAIRSPYCGCMLIPRKDDGLHVFLQLTPEDVQMLDEAKKQSASQGLHSSEAFKLLDIAQSQAQKLLRPYKIVNTFRDQRGSVFLLGDACHTYSLKAGQGMNISISAAYNLTWKLALVMKGLASPELLDTYETERKHVATLLINFDAKFAEAFTQRTNLDDTKFTLVNMKSTEPAIPGKRLLSVPLIRQLGGNSVQLLDEMPADGRFHLFVYASRPLTSEAFVRLSEFLSSPKSPVHRFSEKTPHHLGSFHQETITSAYPKANFNYVVDVSLLHTTPHLEVDLELLPQPLSDKWPTRVDEDFDSKGHVIHGISEEDGALVLVRPDGYVSVVTALDKPQVIVDFLDSFSVDGGCVQEGFFPVKM